MAAARDRGVRPERVTAIRALFDSIPDKDAVYVMRNEAAGRALRRLADMFKQRADGVTLEEAITLVVFDPSEEPTR